MPINKTLVDATNLANKRIETAKKHFETYKLSNYQYYENLYNSKRRKPGNSASWRSNNFIPITFSTVQTELPRFVDGLIGTDGTSFFQVHPFGADEKLSKSAKALTKVQQAYMRGGAFYSHFYANALNAHKYGIAWLKQTWKYEEVSYQYYDMQTKKDETIKKVISEPIWEETNPMDIWIDPNSTCKNDMAYLCERIPLSGDSILALEDTWNQKTEFNKLARIIKTSDDVTCMYDVVTVYTKDDITTICNGCTIRYSKNPYKHHNIPFYPYIRYPEPNKLDGKGIAEILMDLQESINDMHNLILDNMKLSVNKILTKRKEAVIDPKKMSLEPGTIIPLEQKDDIQVLDLGGVHMDSFKMQEVFQGYVNQTAGNLDYINAPTGIGSTNKTASGARIIQQEANRRFAAAIKYNKENGLISMLYDLIELCEQYFDKKNINNLLTADELKELEIEPKNIDLTAKYRYVLTGNYSLLDKAAQIENLKESIGILQALQVPINTDYIAKQIVENNDLPNSVLNVEEMSEKDKGNGADATKKMPPDQIDMIAEKAAPILETTKEQILMDLKEGKVTIEEIVGAVKAKISNAKATGSEASINTGA